MTVVRDEVLGEALRALETPEHAPSFHAELHRRLAEERVSVRRRRRARRSRVVWTARFAVVAAVAALAVVTLDVVRSDRAPGPIGVEPATAAEIQASVREALASARTLSGVLVVRGRSYENAYGWDRPMRWRFVLTATGDFRLTGLTLDEDVAYDASRGVQRSYSASESAGGPTRFAAVRKGVAPGRPDPGPTDPLLQRDFGGLVRAFLAADDVAVREVTYRGRPAWRLDVGAAVNAIVPELSGDRFAVWVDRETGIPVRIVESKGGRALDELRIEGLRVDEEPPKGAFTLRFPPGTEVMRSDDGYRRVELGEAAGAVGYAPLVPAWVPEGYRLAEVAVAGRSGAPTGAEAANPRSTGVVSLSYRRGFDQIVVTTRRRGDPAQVWSDPLATGEGFPDRPERTLFNRGTLSGVEAKLLIVPRNIPHLWALTDDLVLTVAGDVGRSELLRIAESLRPRP